MRATSVLIEKEESETRNVKETWLSQNLTTQRKGDSKRSAQLTPQNLLSGENRFQPEMKPINGSTTPKTQFRVKVWTQTVNRFLRKQILPDCFTIQCPPNQPALAGHSTNMPWWHFQRPETTSEPRVITDLPTGNSPPNPRARNRIIELSRIL